MAVPPSAARRRARWLPAGRPLSSEDAARRHALVCLLALAHVPVLLLLSVLAGDLVTPVGLLAVLALLAVAVGPFPHRSRSLAASAALLLCSVGLLALYPDVPELHGYLFVLVAVVALYQDWAVLGLAVGFAATQNAALQLLLTRQQLGPHPLRFAVVCTGFVVAEAAALAVFWHADEQAKKGEERLQAALWEGQASVRARLEETDRIRTDLIGTVSHEFRTPLTGIRGAALTLLKRGDRLDEGGRKRLLKAVLEQQERLSRLLENMLTAARATAADPAALAEVDAVAAEVAMLAGASRPENPVSVVVEPGTIARIDRHALHQVLANLVDNAQQYGTPGSVPLVAGGTDGDQVWVAVSNEGGPLDPGAARHLFEPFTQGDGGPTRNHEGLGMGLYVVRRLVEVYGGWVTVRAEGGWVTVEIRLKAATCPLQQEQPQGQEPTALPIR
ncbi:MAG: HAMP domain-containing sensor histidine kinase [Mycobacteriales bacterium]